MVNFILGLIWQGRFRGTKAYFGCNFTGFVLEVSEGWYRRPPKNSKRRVSLIRSYTSASNTKSKMRFVKVVRYPSSITSKTTLANYLQNEVRYPLQSPPERPCQITFKIGLVISLHTMIFLCDELLSYMPNRSTPSCGILGVPWSSRYDHCSVGNQYSSSFRWFVGLFICLGL